MGEIVLAAGLAKDTVDRIVKHNADPDRCVQTFFRIKNKQRQVVDFRYNKPQQLNSQRSTSFDRVLKARKMGISSRRIARDLWICSTRKNEHRIALTHTGDAASKIMTDRVKPFIYLCKYPLGAIIRSDYVHFPATGSRYYIGTAGAKKFGRGDDITGRHFLETAHWPGPDVIGGVDEAMVDNSDGLDETTANGHNFWKLSWDKAKKGQTKERAIFLPWYVEEEYQRDPALETGPLSEKEQQLVNVAGLTAEQIAWRRWKLRTMTDPALFPQEYPETDQEAFLSSGRPVFDWLALAKHRATVSEPKHRGYLSLKQGKPELVIDPNGTLRIWKVPERGHVYAIGSDVAEGLQDGAYTTGEVIDLGDSEQVAEWHGHIDPTIWADDLDLLGAYYNQAVLIPESWPGPGEVTTSHLASADRFCRVWQGDFKHSGWETNSHTKQASISTLNQSLRDMGLVIRSADLLEELHAFIYDEKMRMGPSVGNFSDRVMGLAIGWAATRDLASRVDYYAVPKVSSLGHVFKSQGTSLPRWQGPRLGVRS